jgi:hypothetical protein
MIIEKILNNFLLSSSFDGYLEFFRTKPSPKELFFEILIF